MRTSSNELVAPADRRLFETGRPNANRGNLRDRLTWAGLKVGRHEAVAPADRRLFETGSPNTKTVHNQIHSKSSGLKVGRQSKGQF